MKNLIALAILAAVICVTAIGCTGSDSKKKDGTPATPSDPKKT